MSRHPRESGKILHETIDLIRQRVFGLCYGYADGNDAAAGAGW